MPKHVVVVGAGLGGLSAAVYARLRGHQVLLLEKAAIGGKAAAIETHGFRFDPGPSIIILTRLYEDVFRAAGRRMEDTLRFRRLDPISRVRFSGETIDLPGSRAECEALVRDRWPEDGKAFRELMAKVDRVAPHIDRSVFRHPYTKPWQLADPHLIATALPFDVRKSYKELVDGLFQSPLLRAFFYGFPSYGGQTYDSKAPGALMIPYLMLQEGVWYPEGGVSAIPRAFADLARDLGVEVRTDAEVTAVVDAGNEIRAVRLRSGERIEADAFISNVDRTTFGRMIGRGEAPPPSLSYFTLQWGLRTRPEGLAHHTLVVPADYETGFEQLYRQRRFPIPPIVYLNETAGTDPAVAPPGAGNLFAVVTSPAVEDEFDWERETPRFRAAVLATLREAGLDVEAHGIEFERIQTPRYFESAHGNYRGTLYGPDESARPFGGMFPPTNRDPEFKNLFYCGGSVQPGAGLPMVTLSGKFAAENV
ncbi:MAG: phytoene desaturase family protein [Fimbriimonas sp.]